MKSCPSCGSTHCVKNGSTHNGKPKRKCKACGRQFVENPQNVVISEETKLLIDNLLLETISLSGIARVTGVSRRWLQSYVNEKYRQVPQQVVVREAPQSGVVIECDDTWSFVRHKANKHWLWFAIDMHSQRIVALHVGRRDAQGARGLWDALPQPYRQSSRVENSFWQTYHTLFLADSSQPIFSPIVRQRLSRLVRRTSAYSKNLENHIGAIWYFVHHYNASLSDNA